MLKTDMPKAVIYSLQTLPKEIQSIVFQEHNADINHTIGAVYELSPQQLNQVIEILVSVITKELPVNKFPLALVKLKLPEVDTSKMALDFAYLRLWPLRSWLTGVDALIASLGGAVSESK